MGMVRRKINEIVGPFSQAYDGASTIYPVAIIRNTASVVIATIDLPHVGGGLYQDTTFLMPDQAMISSQIKVYADAGKTILDTNYEEKVDVYFKDNTPDQAGIVDGSIIGVLDDTTEVIGHVDIGNYDPIVIGSVEEEMLVGTVDPDDPPIIGIVSPDHVIGIVQED